MDMGRQGVAVASFQEDAVVMASSRRVEQYNSFSGVTSVVTPCGAGSGTTKASWSKDQLAVAPWIGGQGSGSLLGGRKGRLFLRLR